MAFFTIKDYLTIGNVENITRTIWEVATDEDFNNIINRAIITKGDLFSCHMALQKEDGNWYEEDDTVYVRVKLYSDNAESPWFLVEPNKAHLISIWINDNLEDNIRNVTKHRVGLIETDKKGMVVTDFIDEVSVSEELKKFREETYREDY